MCQRKSLPEWNLKLTSVVHSQFWLDKKCNYLFDKTLQLITQKWWHFVRDIFHNLQTNLNSDAKLRKNANFTAFDKAMVAVCNLSPLSPLPSPLSPLLKSGKEKGFKGPSSVGISFQWNKPYRPTIHFKLSRCIITYLNRSVPNVDIKKRNMIPRYQGRFYKTFIALDYYRGTNKPQWSLPAWLNAVCWKQASLFWIVRKIHL